MNMYCVVLMLNDISTTDKKNKILTKDRKVDTYKRTRKGREKEEPQNQNTAYPGLVSPYQLAETPGLLSSPDEQSATAGHSGRSLRAPPNQFTHTH